jgi:hypothetical protein
MEHRSNKIIISFIIIILSSSCSNTYKCEFKSIDLIFTDIGSSIGNVSYYHYLCVNNYNRSCIDSLMVNNIVKSYLDTLTTNKPVGSLHLYSSKNRFIEGEKSQIWNDVDKDCLVDVILDNKEDIRFYIFHSADGKEQKDSKFWDPYK